MKKIISILKKSNNNKGFMMILVLMVIVVVSLLGMTLMSVSTANFKATTIDRDYEAVYYIAEAGANQAIYNIGKKVNKLSKDTLEHTDFFAKIKKYIDENVTSVPFDNFEMSFGQQPSAILTVKSDETKVISNDESEQVITYVITSKGKIGDRSRMVSTSIDVIHTIVKETSVEPPPKPKDPSVFDYALYSPKNIPLPSGTQIDGSIYGKDVVVNAANAKITKDIISETFIKIVGAGLQPIIEGNVYALNGYIEVATGGAATVQGDVHANGKVTIGSSATVVGNVYSTEDVEFKNGAATVNGSVHANGNIGFGTHSFIGVSAYLNGNLTLPNTSIEPPYPAPSIIQQNVYAGKNIKMGNNTYIMGISQAGGSINQHNTTAVNMIISDKNKPEDPTFPTNIPITQPKLSEPFPTPNLSEDITVPQSSPNYIIQPGTYGNLKANGGSTIVFKGGDYTFNSISANFWTQKIRLDLSSGKAINVYSVGDIKFNGKFEVSEDGSNWTMIEDLDVETAKRLAGLVYWETKSNFTLTNGAVPTQWFGTVLINKNLDIGSGMQLIGSYVVITGTIKMGSNPNITYAPPTTSAAGGGGTTPTEPEPPVPPVGGVGVTSSTYGGKVKISSVIREK